MNGEHLALGCDLNTVTWPLYEGIVEPKGVDLNFQAFDDLYDLFMSSYFIAVGQEIDNFVHGIRPRCKEFTKKINDFGESVDA